MVGKKFVPVSRESIGEVREKTDLVVFLEEQDIQLRSAGSGTFKALCPIPGHDEKTPSFTVYPDRGFMNCYGCGWRGDVFDFLRDVNSMSFVEALEFLGERGGVVLERKIGGVRPVSKAPLAEMNQVALEFYRGKPNSAVTEFVVSRGFDEGYLRGEWGMGYSEKGLLEHLKQHGYTPQQAVEAGLAFQGKNGTFEAFKGRLMWPIHDYLGRTAGFGARKLYKNDPRQGKFVNTVDTPLYKKSEILFGFNKSRPAINQHKKAILCEGYTDVISYHLADLPISVAACGTSVTEKHIKRLARLLGENGELTVSMDSDPAGLKSATSIINLATKHPLTLTVVLFPPGYDPDQYRQEHGPQALNTLYQNRKPLIEAIIDLTLQNHDTTTPEGATEAHRNATRILETIHDTILRDRYSHYLSQKLGTQPQKIQEKRTHRKEETHTLSWELLRFIYHYPEVFEKEGTPISNNLETIPDQHVRNIITRTLEETTGQEPALWRELILNTTPTKQHAFLKKTPQHLLEGGNPQGYMRELSTRLTEDWFTQETENTLKALTSTEQTAKDFLLNLSKKETEAW